MIFDYPPERTERIHGPFGYLKYQSFRPWLRDEFTFRCVYCLQREAWGQVTFEFELDHFEPQSVAPNRRLDYSNLVYACRRCNSVKTNQSVADPLTLLCLGSVVVLPDGAITGNCLETRRLILQMDLNSPRLQSWRVMWMRILDLAAENDPNLLAQLIGFPEDLPNLSRLRPPGNKRPEGVDRSWHARREAGLLPASY